MNFCPNCGANVNPGEITCSSCGKNLVKTKFCEHCGQKIDAECVVCPKCGKQVGILQQPNQPNIVINNTNTNQNRGAMFYPNLVKKDKWVAFLLCLFLGGVGAHKFYEGKAGLGILYIFTCGLFFIGWFVDLITLLCKPNPYYV